MTLFSVFSQCPGWGLGLGSHFSHGPSMIMILTIMFSLSCSRDAPWWFEFHLLPVYLWTIWSLVMTLISLRRCLQIHCSNICIWQQVLVHSFLSWISIWHRTAWSLPRSCRDTEAHHVMTVCFSIQPLLLLSLESLPAVPLKTMDPEENPPVICYFSQPLIHWNRGGWNNLD